MDKIPITVNGETMEVEKNTTLEIFFSELNLNLEHIAVAVNEEVLNQEQFPGKKINPDDQIEIIHFVGGG